MIRHPVECNRDVAVATGHDYIAPTSTSDVAELQWSDEGDRFERFTVFQASGFAGGH